MSIFTESFKIQFPFFSLLRFQNRFRRRNVSWSMEDTATVDVEVVLEDVDVVSEVVSEVVEVVSEVVLEVVEVVSEAVLAKQPNFREHYASKD